MLDPETRRKVERTRDRRLFREALAKRRMESEGLNVDLDKVKLPSFAEIKDKETKTIKCKICFEECHILKFKKHLTEERHLMKIEELKKQLMIDEEKEARMIKNVIDEDEFEDDALLLGKREPLEALDPEEAAKNMVEEFEKKNKVDLPAGFFDDKKEQQKFETEESKRIKKLKRKAGLVEVKGKIAGAKDKEGRELLMRLQEDVDKIEAGQAGKEAANGSNSLGGIGRDLIKKESDFLADRVKAKIERLKRLREMKKKRRKL